MSFVHCTVCFCTPSKDVKFYFSSCAHVACVRCVEKGCFLLKCKICQKENPRILEINPQLKPDIADMFSPLQTSLQKVQSDMNRIMDFQSMHRNRLIDQLYSKVDMFNKLKDYCQGEIKKKEEYKQEVVKLSNYKRQADNHIQKLQAHIKNSSSSSNTASVAVPRAKNNSMNLTAMTHDPFRTPAARGGHRSFVTSTPLPDVSMGDRSSIDASLSFSAATGFPKTSDTTGDLSALASKTQACDLNGGAPPVTTTSGGGSGSKRRACANDAFQNEFSQFSASRSQPLSTNKVPAPKKTRLDILSKTQPLPMK